MVASEQGYFHWFNISGGTKENKIHLLTSLTNNVNM